MIITGGIDLSIGAVVCLSGVLLPWLAIGCGWPPVAALTLVLGLAAGLGALHGVLVTRLGLQPFVVTLCGLLIYRGAARTLTGDQSQGFGLALGGLRRLAVGRIPLPGIDGFALPAPVVILTVVGLVAALLLNGTVFGRHLRALGRSEAAARFSGVRTAAVTTVAYAIGAGLAGLGGVLFVLDVNSAQPADFGNFYELYAIAAAVLGGCSLRGGEGSILGVVLGTAVMQVLRNATILLDIPTQMEYAVIGGVILVGALADEALHRMTAARRG